MLDLSSVPSRTLSVVASDAEHCSRRPQGNACSIPHNKLDRSRENQHARSPRLTQVTRMAVGVMSTAALIDLIAPAHRRAGARNPATTRIVITRVAGALMEFIEGTDAGVEPIPITRCRELLGEEADSLTDQEVASIRRHAATMAWILVEMYSDGCQLPE
jgi:hypothetical protein